MSQEGKRWRAAGSRGAGASHQRHSGNTIPQCVQHEADSAATSPLNISHGQRVEKHRRRLFKGHAVLVEIAPCSLRIPVISHR